MPYPRPILKRFGASLDDSDSPNSSEGGLSRINTNANKVHFPNHPDALTRTHLVHSPDVYDRSPISIRRNDCALPERGCPGRTYSDNGVDEDMDVDDCDRASQKASAHLKKADHHHPCARVVGFLKSGHDNELSNSPTLIQDLSDTSEDSDNSYSSTYFSDALASSSVSHNRCFSSSASSSSLVSSSHSPRLSPKGDPAQLAFLPYPHPSPQICDRSSACFYPPEFSARDSRSARRSPSSPTRQRQRSRSRVRGSPVRDRHGAVNKQGAYGYREDEGCLGGF